MTGAFSPTPTVKHTGGPYTRSHALRAPSPPAIAAEIRILCGGAAVQGEGILDLMGLAAAFGVVLERETHGPGAAEAVVALSDLISARPHEIDDHQVA